jgi:hypothetical protein
MIAQMIRGFLRSLFAPDPIVGEVYVRDDDDPFTPMHALVLEVRLGWVKYEQSWTNIKGNMYHSTIEHDSITDFKLFWKYDKETNESKQVTKDESL